MFTFTSVNPKRRIFGKPVKSPDSKEMVPEYDVKFERHGSVGHFITEDEQVAEKLRQHPEFNKNFTEMAMPKNLVQSNVVEGIRSSETHPELGQVQQDPAKFIRYGVLQNKLLKNDQTYRKDALPEEIAEYEQLKKEIDS